VELYLNSQYVFMAWCLVKHRDNFTFTYHFNCRDNGEIVEILKEVTCLL